MWGHGGRYEDWATFLERWGAGEPVDAGGLPRLTPDDFTGDSWERLTDRLTAALSQRLQSWADALGRAVNEARDEFSVGRALTAGRGGLRPIRVLAAHPALPAELTGRLLDLVDQQVRSAQRSLEEQVERMRRTGASRSAVEARLRTIRDNSLSVVTTETPAGTGTPHGWSAGAPVATRRRVIVNDPPDRTG
jgi:hypothetical protein